MQRILSRLCLLALAGWVGGGLLYTFVLTPAVFHAYGRDRAGEVVGGMMPHYFGFTFAAVAAAALLLLLLRSPGAPRLRAACLGLAFSALLVQGYLAFRLYPQIVEVKATVASFEADPDSPPRRRFRALHGTSMALNLLVLAEGAALLLLLPLPRRD